MEKITDYTKSVCQDGHTGYWTGDTIGNHQSTSRGINQVKAITLNVPIAQYARGQNIFKSKAFYKPKSANKIMPKFCNASVRCMRERYLFLYS